MSLTVTVNGVQVRTTGIHVSNVANSNPDSATFTLIAPAAAPGVGQEVRVILDTTGAVLFGGIIVSVQESAFALETPQYLVTCSDYQRLLDRKLVARSYVEKTCREIIEDLVASFTDPALGFTTENVEEGRKINKINFNYVPVSQCIKDLAALVSYEWYIDENKDIHFFEREKSFGPVELSDAALANAIQGFNITPDYSQVRNRITVRGGYSLSDPYPESQVADGVQRIWKLGYKPSELSLEVDGAPVSIGVENLDADDGAFDYMMNYQEASVRCSEHPGKTTTPAAGTVMSFTYRYQRPVIVYVNDYESQAAIAAVEGGDGVYEHVIKDETLSSTQEAHDRAMVELNSYARPVFSGGFKTLVHGFRAGQTVVVNRAGQSFNGNYQVQSVDIGCQGGIVEYEVSFASNQYDLVDYLRGLAAKLNRIELREDEVIDLVENIDEVITFEDTVTVVLNPRVMKWGSAKWGFFTWA
ncbi:hypothetical protein LLH00_05965 [bacterium]|nr:hypothetical protein [bacterium]